MRTLISVALTGGLFFGAATACGADAVPREKALATMKKAAAFFRNRIATEGGYLWRYSPDLSKRAGEGNATPTQIWVQPPGTPAVGETFLKVHEATKDTAYRDDAVKAARALAWGQLATGGWDYRIDFDSKQCKKWYYRRDLEAGDTDRGKRRCVTTFDDNTSQSALRLLMLVDRAIGGKDPEIRKAVEFALKGFLEAQYPNGAWPQRHWAKYDPEKHPIIKARYPKTWSREHPKVSYASFYTWNDNAIADCVRTLLLAHEIYKKPEYKAAAVKAGDFAILAQMPDPQPVWAQQYNFDMEPAWARRFEPPSVTGGESNAALRVLKTIYQVTGDAKYIEPIPRALAWYKRSKLPGGYWARFYEFQTNKPLYFVKDTYALTYDDGNMPTHYSFKSKGMYPTAIEAWYEGLMKLPAGERAAHARAQIDKAKKARPKASAKAVRKIVDAMDDQGRWITKGWIECATFNRNMRTLAAYASQE